MWFLILEHHTPPPFFDIRTIYSFFVNGEGKEGGGNRIQTEHVIGGGGGGVCEILVEGTKRGRFNVFLSGGTY